MTDSSDLERFVTAQDREHVRGRAGITRRAQASHWMWFVFPQLRGLGAARRPHFGIASREEAAAYLAHDVLGPRLRQFARC